MQAASASRERRSTRHPTLFAACASGLLLAVVSVRAFVSAPGLPKPSEVQSRALVARSAQSTLERPKISSEWRLGVGNAIDVLRRDVPALFSKEQHTPDFSIYSEDMEVVDARLPSFQLKGLATYQQMLSTIRWSAQNAFEHTRMEITSMMPPVENEIYMRWRLHIWFKDVLAPARGFLAPAFGRNSIISGFDGTATPFIVEGYSRYELDPWSAQIVKHTIDITNPPMYLSDLIKQYTQVPAWLTPVGTGMGVPSVFPMEASTALLAGPSSEMASHPLAGTTESRHSRVSIARPSGNWFPGLPQGCEDDFECNDGKANFPLQCCELPLLGKFCCEPSDYEPVPQNPAYVPLPVPVDDDIPKKFNR